MSASPPSSELFIAYSCPVSLSFASDIFLKSFFFLILLSISRTSFSAVSPRFLIAGLIPSQFVTAPKHLVTQGKNALSLIPSQFVTAPKLPLENERAIFGLIPSQFVTAPKRLESPSG